MELDLDGERAATALPLSPPRSPGLFATAATALVIGAANLPVVLRYGGPGAGLAFVLAGVGLLLGVLSWRGEGRAWRVIAAAALVAGLALQFALLLFVAPHYDGRMDRDDALVLWWQRLLAGENPYAAPTSMGNPISILPFLHIVALPFVLLGNVGLLPIAATAALAWLLARHYRDDGRARSLALLALAGAPLLLFEAAGRSELAANMLLLVVLLLWAERWANRPRLHELPWLGLLIGAVAATRFALWPAIALPALFLLRCLTLRQAAVLIAGALASFAALVLPFVIWDPAVFFGYAPFGVNATKLGGEPASRLFWAAATLVTFVGALLYAVRTGRLFPAATAVLLTITLATCTTFGLDVAYGQLVFVPALFTLARRRYGADATL